MGSSHLIANPAWPEHVKIGITTNIDSRLSTYQTGDPFRGYYVKHYEFVLDRKSAERNTLSDYNINIENGEWLANIDATRIITELRNKWGLRRAIINNEVIDRTIYGSII